MRKQSIMLIAVMCVAMMLLAGCVELIPVTVRGGGWIDAEPMMPEQVDGRSGKATFGFTVECYDYVYEDDFVTNYSVRGHLSYVDKVNGIRINGDVIFATLDGDDMGIFSGTCAPGMHFTVGVTGSDKPGEYGTFFIELSNDEGEILYMNGGPIRQGNIRIFS
ncbi:MAG: hypothetical protein R6W96_08975 [Clostridia bacterium]